MASARRTPGVPTKAAVKVIKDYKRWLVGQDPDNIGISLVARGPGAGIERRGDQEIPATNLGRCEVYDFGPRMHTDTHG